MPRIDIDQRVAELAGRHPDRPAFIGVDPAGIEQVLSWRELDQRSAEQRAHASAWAPGVVLIPTANDAGSLVALLGALRAGCVALLTERASRGLTIPELAATVAAATGLAVWYEGERLVDAAGPPPSPPGGSVLLTGGTSGSPKIVFRPGRPYWDSDRGAPLLFQQTGWREGQTQLVAGGWYHAAPFSHLIEAVLSGATVLAPQLFNPVLVLAAMERHRPEWAQLTPSHLQLLAPLLAEHPGALQSLRGVLHTAGPCAPRTREAWIAALGAERLYEMYAATESIGVTLCRADEWIARPGTVGRGFFTRIRIYDENGDGPLEPGEVGMVYMRTLAATGGVRLPAGVAEPRDGFRTVQDIGYLDAEGYLYLAGRRDDMVIVGGENVRLDGVVAALMSHEAVADAAVIAVPDDTFGQRLVALVVPNREGDLRMTLLTHCLALLAPREVPAEIHVVESLERSSAGKLRPDVLRELVGQHA